MVENRETERPLTRAYHFTHKRNLFDIEYGGNIMTFDNGKKGVNPPGLYPKTDYLGDDRGYTFCFMGSPFPQEWKQDPGMYKFLLNSRGGSQIQLLSFDVFPDDNAYVVDCGVLDRRVDENGHLTPFPFEKVIDYLNSMVPLTEYKGGYRLPELLIPKVVAYNRLTHVSPQKVESWLDKIL